MQNDQARLYPWADTALLSSSGLGSARFVDRATNDHDPVDKYSPLTRLLVIVGLSLGLWTLIGVAALATF